MAYDATRHHRRTVRLKDWDYSWPWWYYVTICVQHKGSLLGHIVNENMVRNDLGDIVNESWLWLPQQYPYVELDEFQILPDHLHGIIVINEPRRGGSRTAPTDGQKVKPLGGLIGAFKTVSTKQINKIRNTPGISFWQRSFHDHIIRNEADLYRIREYIKNNPLQWDIEKEGRSEGGE